MHLLYVATCCGSSCKVLVRQIDPQQEACPKDCKSNHSEAETEKEIDIYIRDSRFSRLGTETPRLSVKDSSRSRNRTRIFKDFRTGIGLGIKLFIILEPEPVSESDFEGCGTGIGTGIEILAPDLIHTILAVFTLKKCKKGAFLL